VISSLSSNKSIKFPNFSPSSSEISNPVPSLTSHSLFLFIVKPQETAPEAAKLAPFLVHIVLISVTVLLVLSVTALIKIPTPAGPKHSYITSCKSVASDPVAFFIALSILSFGTFSFFALSITEMTEAEFASPPAFFTAT
jgi:hypothetical protein